MRIALLADSFVPMGTAAAIQLRDLARELVSQGHDVTAIIASPEVTTSFSREFIDGVDVLRVKTPKTKDTHLIARAFGELKLPFDMLRGLAKSPLAKAKWDGIVWYLPTIFLGYAAHRLKQRLNCPAYLIVRDIFPDWAVDLGLMKRGFAYRFFKWVERFQYKVADTIGVQSPGNLAYFDAWSHGAGRRLEVLENWLSPSPSASCRIDISKTALAGRTILVYSGNMGVAQNLQRFVNLAASLDHCHNLGFVFVGRGSQAEELKSLASRLQLKNLLFFDEIAPSEIAGLLRQCHIGIVSLDMRHRTHNVPGKFLSYMNAGLPVFAALNPGNDLVTLIEDNRMGRVTTIDDQDALLKALELLLGDLKTDANISRRGREMAKQRFSSATAAKKITEALQAK